MKSLIAATLRPRQAGPAIGGHPWVYAGKIGNMDGKPAEGDAVRVLGGDDGRFIAYGLFNSKSDIRVRLYSWNEEEPIDDRFWKQKVEQAVSLRRELYGPWKPEQACRLIYSESDGLSGLVVDQYGEYLVVQCTSLALSFRLETLIQSLQEVCRPKGILVKGVKDFGKKEGLELADSVRLGEAPVGSVRIREGGVHWEVDLISGQKTGFFLDQSENRLRVAEYARGKRVLDLFCYSGGFAIHCARAGAKEVIGVDSSVPAIQKAKQNAQLNEVPRTEFVESDAFDYLKEYSDEPFDLMVVDPPRFVTSTDSKERALKKYYSLNTEALKVVKPNGLLVSCSCSGRVSIEEWVRLLSSVARRSRRFLQILELRGAGRDHPINPHCSETQYLKCVIAHVS